MRMRWCYAQEKAVNAKTVWKFRYGKERIWHFKDGISADRLSSDYKKLFKAMQNFSQICFWIGELYANLTKEKVIYLLEKGDKTLEYRIIII